MIFQALHARSISIRMLRILARLISCGQPSVVLPCRAEAGGAFATPPRTRAASSAPGTPAEGGAGAAEGAGAEPRKVATPLTAPRSGAKTLSLAQIQVAASIALESSITSPAIKKALTSRESFEVRPGAPKIGRTLSQGVQCSPLAPPHPCNPV